MTKMLTARAFGLAVVLAAALTGLAVAEDVKIPDGELPPPPEQAEPAKKKPVQCVSEQSGFRRLNGENQFFVELTNSCETRQRCKINVYVVGAKGGKTGEGTVILAKASRGNAAKKSWTIRTTENGGMASMSRKCTAL